VFVGDGVALNKRDRLTKKKYVCWGRGCTEQKGQTYKEKINNIRKNL